MLIPSNYYLPEGKDAPEGTVLKKCKFCKGTFAVPADVAKDIGDADVCDSAECKEKADKEGAAAAAALMKPNTDATNTIKTALGN